MKKTLLFLGLMGVSLFHPYAAMEENKEEEKKLDRAARRQNVEASLDTVIWEMLINPKVRQKVKSDFMEVGYFECAEIMSDLEKDLDKYLEKSENADSASINKTLETSNTDFVSINNTLDTSNTVTADVLYVEYRNVANMFQKLQDGVLQDGILENFQNVFEEMQGALYEQCFFFGLDPNMTFDNDRTDALISPYKSFINGLAEIQHSKDRNCTKAKRKLMQTTFEIILDLLIKSLELYATEAIKMKYFDEHVQGMWEEREGNYHFHYTLDKVTNKEYKKVLQYYLPEKKKYVTVNPEYFVSEKITKIGKILNEGEDSLFQNEYVRLEKKLLDEGKSEEERKKILKDFTQSYTEHQEKAAAHIQLRNAMTESYANIVKILWRQIQEEGLKKELPPLTKAQINFSQSYFRRSMYYPSKDFDCEETLIEILHNASVNNFVKDLTFEDVNSTKTIEDYLKNKIEMFNDNIYSDNIKIIPPKKKKDPNAAKKKMQQQKEEQERQEEEERMLNHQYQMLSNPQYKARYQGKNLPQEQLQQGQEILQEQIQLQQGQEAFQEQIQLQQGQEALQEQIQLQQEQEALQKQQNDRRMQTVKNLIEDLQANSAPDTHYVLNNVLRWAYSNFSGKLVNKVGSHEKYSFTSINGQTFCFKAWKFHNMKTAPQGTCGHYIHNLLNKLLK